MDLNWGRLLLGAWLLFAGGDMIVTASRYYAQVMPSSLWVLYIYVPIGAVLLAFGVVVVAREQARYARERRGPLSPPPRVSD